MFKLSTGSLLLALTLLTACQDYSKTEQEDRAFWDAAVVDSSTHLLYQYKDTVRALAYFDSVLNGVGAGRTLVYPRASRYTLLANYHYFFTLDDAATAKMINAALALYDSPELQDRYPRSYVRLLLFGGQIAYRLTEYTKANEYYFKAKKLADNHLSPCERAAFNYSIAMVLYRQQNFSQSLSYYTEAFALQESCALQTTAVVLQQQEIQSNIGLCLIRLKQYDSALLHFERASTIAERYRDSLGAVTMDKIEGVIYGNKAEVATDQKRLDEAEHLFQKSLFLTDREGYDPAYAASIKLQLAEIYNRKKNYPAMIGALRGFDTAKYFTDARLGMEWNHLLASYYEQTARPDSALHFFKRYDFLEDSLAEVQKQLTAADVARQLRDKEQNTQIAVLKKDQHLTLVSLWVTVSFSVMAVAILFLIYLIYRRNKKSLALSLALNEEIRRQKAARETEERQRHKLITDAVIQAQEHERSLIGLELHDNINQVLTTVKLHNEMLLDGIGDSRLILPRTIKYLQDCINEIRSLSRRLSAPTLGKIDLEESVKELIESVNLTSKVKITHRISGFNSQPTSQEIHLGVYRILQEQLNNVLKHAEASEVLVCLQRDEDILSLTVTDNGKGFATARSKNGIGLMNMQTRAENLNGTFGLHSQPGKGCTLEVVLPY